MDVNLAVWVVRCMYFNYIDLGKLLIDYVTPDNPQYLTHYISKIGAGELGESANSALVSFWGDEFECRTFSSLAMVLRSLTPRFDLSLIEYMLKKGEHC